MAGDLKILWDTTYFEGDLSFSIVDQDLEMDEGLATAVIISLFTDRRAEDDDILPDSNNMDRRGWWGDLVSPVVLGDQIGSRLWLLERSKTEQEVLLKTKEYAEESLQWMIDDMVAQKVEVDVERAEPVGSDRLYFKVYIHKDKETQNINFEVQWDATANY